MTNLEELISECITPDAIEHKIKFYKYHRVKEDAYFWANIHTLMADYIEKEMRSSNDDASIYGIGLQRRHNNPTCVGSYVDPAIQRIKTTYECISELKDDLMRGNGELTYDFEFRDTDDFSHWFLQELYKDVFHSGEWLLQENYAEFNKWDWRKGKRIYNKLKIYRLIHLDGTQMIFDLPKEKKEQLHIIMFKMLPEKQGNYFLMLKRFRFLFNVLCVERNMLGLQSPCLGGDMPDCPIKEYNNKEDWRFVKKNLGGNNCDAYSLMLMWLRVGAVRPKLENDNPDNLFFFHPKEVLKVKELMKEEFGINVFQHIGKSIYSADLTKKLREDI